MDFGGHNLGHNTPTLGKPLSPVKHLHVQGSQSECPISMKFSPSLSAQLPSCLLCSWALPTSAKSPWHDVAGMKAGFLLLPLGDMRLIYSWGISVPTTIGLFWLGTVQSILCMATCIIHEGGLVSPRTCCSFARIMGFDRTPCHAGLLVISVVITIPFLITYPWWPLSATVEETPLFPHAEASWVTAAVPLQPLGHRLLWGFLFSSCFSSFPIFWFLSHAPLNRWTVTPLMFYTIALKGLSVGEQVFKSLCSLSPTQSALPAFTLGGGSSVPRLQPALSQVEKNSKGDIIFKSLNVLSGCFGNLTSGKRFLDSGLVTDVAMSAVNNQEIEDPVRPYFCLSAGNLWSFHSFV